MDSLSQRFDEPEPMIPLAFLLAAVAINVCIMKLCCQTSLLAIHMTIWQCTKEWVIIYARLYLLCNAESGGQPVSAF